MDNTNVAPGKMLILVTAILFCVFSGIGLLMMLAAARILLAFTLHPKVLFYVIFGLLSGALGVALGVMGVMNANKQEKAPLLLCLILAYFGLWVLSFVFAIIQGGFPIFSIIGLVIPVLYFLGVKKNLPADYQISQCFNDAFKKK